MKKQNKTNKNISYSVACDANDLDCAVATQSHVREHLLISFGRWAIHERGCKDRAKQNCIVQTEIHALAAGGRVDVSSVTDKAHHRASGARLISAAAKVGEEVACGGVARAEA